MSAQVSNTVLVMSFAQAKLVATGFTDTAKMLAVGVRKATPYIKHGATAVHKAMTTAYAAEDKVLSGFKLSSFKHAHAVAVLLAKHDHTLTDEDFDRWAVAGVRIVRTVKFGGVMKLTDVLATEGVGTSLEAVEAKADEIEQSKTDERRDDAASKREARPNDGSKKTKSDADADADGEPNDEPSAPKVSGTNKGVVAVAGDATSLTEVSFDRLIREIEGRIRTGCEIDETSVKHFDRMVEAYAERMAAVTA
jgi:hypothetical protein